MSGEHVSCATIKFIAKKIIWSKCSIVWYISAVCSCCLSFFLVWCFCFGYIRSGISIRSLITTTTNKFKISSHQNYTMCKMPTKNHIDWLDTTGQAVHIPFGMFFVWFMWSATIYWWRICISTRSNSVSWTLFRNSWGWNNIKWW